MLCSGRLDNMLFSCIDNLLVNRIARKLRKRVSLALRLPAGAFLKRCAFLETLWVP